MTEVCATAVTEYNFCNRVGSVGIPMVKNNIMIYDHETKTEATYNVEGEVCINSPSLMIGYQNNPEEYEQLVQVHADGVKWVHTGDLGYITEEGFLYISGRMKRMIFLGPEGMLYKVFPKNIEDVINQVDEIRESCVVSKKVDGKLVAINCLENSGVHMTINDKEDVLKMYDVFWTSFLLCKIKNLTVIFFHRTKQIHRNQKQSKRHRRMQNILYEKVENEKVS